ncbi:MAG TPA: peptidoglycan-associated lipoprotein Pal [Terriglobales bacterium]|nr:peptidoglycan-associated lipoprotein Pal [Terriglobales bacterium]
MKTFSRWFSLSVAAGLVLAGAAACASKAVQSGGETGAGAQPPAKAAAKGPEGVNPGFPDTSVASKDTSSGLRGMDKSPSEERVNSGPLVAKLEPSQGARQAEEIRSEMAATEAAGLRDVFFAFDSFAITEEGRQSLSRDADWARSNPAGRLRIEGHCDERGTSAYNIVLGEKRAKTVRNYLVELGIDTKRLAVVSYGKERPFCKDHEETCYAQNRRGHLVVRTSK